MRHWPPPLLLLLLWWGLPAARGLHYPHSAVLDGASRYRLLWAPQGGSIAFRLEVHTRGYVGFGFSPTGAMASADLVLGGVDGGKPYLQVRGQRCGVGTAKCGEARLLAGLSADPVEGKGGLSACSEALSSSLHWHPSLNG